MAVYSGYVSCHTANNITISNIKPTAVRILAIFTRPANANTAEIAKGKIISQVMAYASDILCSSGIFGLIVVTPAKIKIPTITVASIPAISLSSNNLKLIQDQK
jgi:hypothetical protein